MAPRRGWRPPSASWKASGSLSGALAGGGVSRRALLGRVRAVLCKRWLGAAQLAAELRGRSRQGLAPVCPCCFAGKGRRRAAGPRPLCPPTSTSACPSWKGRTSGSRRSWRRCSRAHPAAAPRRRASRASWRSCSRWGGRERHLPWLCSLAPLHEDGRHDHSTAQRQSRGGQDACEVAQSEPLHCAAAAVPRRRTTAC